MNQKMYKKIQDFQKALLLVGESGDSKFIARKGLPLSPRTMNSQASKCLEIGSGRRIMEKETSRQRCLNTSNSTTQFYNWLLGVQYRVVDDRSSWSTEIIHHLSGGKTHLPDDSKLTGDPLKTYLYTWMFIFVDYLLPLTCIVILNTITVIKLRRMTKNRREISDEQRNEDKLTTMIFYVVLEFLVCTSFSGFTTLMTILRRTYSFSEIRRRSLNSHPRLSNSDPILRHSITGIREFYEKLKKIEPAGALQLIIVVLNTITFIKLRKLNTKRREISIEQKNENKLTAMMLYVVLEFMVCTSINGFIALMLMFPRTEPYSYSALLLMWQLRETFNTLNSSVNIVTYLSSWLPFRRSFMKMFCCETASARNPDQTIELQDRRP
ncbi:hypothetical protein GE061_003182 [Apolygus lucorum]|uniref:G-protein coupled receptors family 1 profile domain-containing protein n=1 Tax=Apolygus lucorum TaxID=248454 RepID=A0A8S9X2T1_APOLU|nr:hypothetical protein GE061_003182 [Apolygus lucorum]